MHEVVVGGQLVVDAHVSQLVSADVADSADINPEEHAVLATAAGDRQLPQLALHLVHQTRQLALPASINPTFLVALSFLPRDAMHPRY